MKTGREYSAFVRSVEPKLRRAFAGSLGVDRAPDALAEALAWGWENRGRLAGFENPVGYLFRVGQSKTRTRKRPELPPPEPDRLPEIEPGLVDALRSLPERQRAAVWLVHACGWNHREVAEALEITRSTVSTHVTRGLDALRIALGEVADV